MLILVIKPPMKIEESRDWISTLLAESPIGAYRVCSLLGHHKILKCISGQQGLCHFLFNLMENSEKSNRTLPYTNLSWKSVGAISSRCSIECHHISQLITFKDVTKITNVTKWRNISVHWSLSALDLHSNRLRFMKNELHLVAITHWRGAGNCRDLF